jgi:hypothetical protein
VLAEAAALWYYTPFQLRANLRSEPNGRSS